MTVEAILQSAWTNAATIGWDWLWLLLLVPVFMLWNVAAEARRRVARKTREREARNDRLARIQSKRKSRLIAIVHREENVVGLPLPVRSSIKQDDAEQTLAAIRATNPKTPLDIILHTPGGVLRDALQIARAIKAHPARKTVFVPHQAMSGGTLIALAADEIIMSPHAVLGPIDPQVAGLPAATWLKVSRQKPVASVNDDTLLFADISEKVLDQMRRQACELMQGNYSHDGSCAISDLLASGKWSHDYPITVPEANELGLNVSTAMPDDIVELTASLSAPDTRRPGVYFTKGRV